MTKLDKSVRLYIAHYQLELDIKKRNKSIRLYIVSYILEEHCSHHIK